MDERYPVGKFQVEGDISADAITGWIQEIENLPKKVREATRDLDDEKLDTRYRSGGWTVRQVVHHLADSHANAYIRVKLALTEEAPAIKDYNEQAWAELPDSKLPVEPSLLLLEALHIRLVELLRGLTPAELEKTFIHPESGEASISENIGKYAWHGRHHLAHITSLRKKQNW